MYNVGSAIVHEKEDVETIGDGDNGVRNRKNKTAAKRDGARKLKFVIKPMDSVKTDFSGEEPLLRVIRINQSGNLMATGLF